MFTVLTYLSLLELYVRQSEDYIILAKGIFHKSNSRKITFIVTNKVFAFLLFKEYRTNTAIH